MYSTSPVWANRFQRHHPRGPSEGCHIEMDTVGSCTDLGAVMDWQREQERVLRELPEKAGPPVVAVVA